MDVDPIIESTPPAALRPFRGSWFALGAAAVCLAGLTAGLVLIAPDDGSHRQIVQDSPPASAPIPTP